MRQFNQVFLKIIFLQTFLKHPPPFPRIFQRKFESSFASVVFESSRFPSVFYIVPAPTKRIPTVIKSVIIYYFNFRTKRNSIYGLRWTDFKLTLIRRLPCLPSFQIFLFFSSVLRNVLNWSSPYYFFNFFIFSYSMLIR